MTTVKVNQEWTHTFNVLMWAVYNEDVDTWEFFGLADDDGGLFHHPDGDGESEEDGVPLDEYPRVDIEADLGELGTDWDELTPDQRSRMITWYMNEG